MALIDVRLVEGTGERQKSVWEARCPVCQTNRRFDFDHTAINVAKAVGRGISGALLNPFQFWPNLLTSSNAVDLVGCLECSHFMVICANCRKAFSADANATTYECPACHTVNA